LHLNKALGHGDLNTALLVKDRWHHRNGLELLHSVLEYIRYLVFTQFIFFFSREIIQFLHINIEIGCRLVDYLGLLLLLLGVGLGE
jgi:hypothetical protein